MTPEEPNESQNILLPETITDEQIAALGPVIFPKFERQYLDDLKSLIADSKAAAAEQDKAKMQAVRHKMKEFESMISRWSERLGAPVNGNFKALEQAYRDAGDDILAALGGELPGQGGGG